VRFVLASPMVIKVRKMNKASARYSGANAEIIVGSARVAVKK